MTWSYRIIRHKDKYEKELYDKLKKDKRWKGKRENIWYAIHEVHYRKNGKPYLVTTEPINIIGNNKDELLNDLFSIMKDAFHYPVLDYSSFFKKKKGAKKNV